MFEIMGAKRHACDRLSRRHFLKAGALGIGGVTLADILRAEETAGQSTGKCVINVYLAGGPSHMDTFDLKTSAPKEFRGEFNPIETSVPGIEICEHMPLVASRMKDLSIIRSISGLNDEHSPNQTEAGWSFNALRSIGGHPCLGSVVSKLQGGNDPSSPAFVDLTGHTENGFLGPVYAGFRPDGPGRSDLRLNNVTLERLDDRQKLLGCLDRMKKGVDTAGMMEAMDSFTERAVSVITSGRMSQALDLDQEDPRIRNRYRANEEYSENDRFLLARRLIEAGVRCVSLSWGGWDTHSDNFNHLKNQLPRLDIGLSCLIDDLQARGLYEQTMILVWGEFGRTPRVNGTAGRDHWSRVASVLLGGGGLRGGQVVGTTNRLGEVAKDRPVHFQEVFATIYSNLGIDPRYTTLIDPNGRPQYLVEQRDTVRELL